MTSAAAYLLVEGDESQCIDLERFIAANEFPAGVEDALRGLQPGESFEDGGGASPAWVVIRTDLGLLEQKHAGGAP